MRCLIAGTSYVANHDRRDLTKLWARLTRHLNPGVDIIVVDSASPMNPEDFLEDKTIKHWRFSDNIGHRSLGGKDGYGRAFIQSLKLAIERNYDYVLSTDSDILLSRPVTPLFEKMKRTGVKACAPIDFIYHFLENGLAFLDVRYLVKSKFIERYDWENTPIAIVPERHFEAVAGDDLWVMPLRGMRNDGNRLNWNNYDRVFPYGMEYLTHCADMTLYNKFLRANKIELP